MTRRDLAWRGLGGGIMVLATVLGQSVQPEQNPAVVLPAFCLVLFGVVLVVQGRRVPAALRIERSRHRTLAQAIRARRRQTPDDEK